MKPLLASFLLLLAACAFGSEDITLSDGRTFTDASIGALDKDRCVIISGKDYAARVPLSLLPDVVQERIDPMVTSKQAAAEARSEPTRPRENIEISNLKVEAVDTSEGIVTYSWLVLVSNNTDRTLVLRSSIKLLRKDGLELTQATGGPSAIKPFGKEILTGSGLVKEVLWRQKANAEVLTLP